MSVERAYFCDGFPSCNKAVNVYETGRIPDSEGGGIRDIPEGWEEYGGGDVHYCETCAPKHRDEQIAYEKRE